MVLGLRWGACFPCCWDIARARISALDGNFLSVFAKGIRRRHFFTHVSLLVLARWSFLLSVTLDLQTTIAGILAVRLIVQFIGQGRGIDDVRRRWGRKNFRQDVLYPVPAVLTMFGWRGFFLADGTGSEVGIAGDWDGRAGVFDLGEGEEQWPFEGRKVISHQLSAISKKKGRQSSVVSLQLKELFEPTRAANRSEESNARTGKCVNGCAWWQSELGRNMRKILMVVALSLLRVRSYAQFPPAPELGRGWRKRLND